MKKSRVILLVVVVAVLLLLVLPSGIASATNPVLWYANDWPGWQRAVGTYGMETFNDPFLNHNLTVATANGYIHPAGYWEDNIWTLGGQQTTWYFERPIRAWGGWWDLPSGQILMGYLGIDGVWYQAGDISSGYDGQFWGFRTTSMPFTAVILVGNSGWYRFDDMVWNSTIYYPGFIGKGGMRPGCFGPPSYP
jgi:hypothetical protein